ncbi:hypothetical protein ANTRET_LOCUS9713 [Anthophora retusa]
MDGDPVHRKIRPPGASRRRATDNHVTLLPYSYEPVRYLPSSVHSATLGANVSTTGVYHLVPEYTSRQNL